MCVKNNTNCERRGYRDTEVRWSKLLQYLRSGKSQGGISKVSMKWIVKEYVK